MAFLTERSISFPPRISRNLSWICSLTFVASIVGWAYVGKSITLGVYALAFWHYYLYWLAYYFGEVSLSEFKRDAILMKSCSLVGLGWLYLMAPVDFVSLSFVGVGFLLNILAARALGADRTYYGYELADLPRVKITTFPYSMISHPMLVGNIAAFGGTLINADFRSQWGVLACGHVALNLGLLAMELTVTPQRRKTRRLAESSVDQQSSPIGFGIILAVGAALAAAFYFGDVWNSQPLLETGAAICILAYAYALYHAYSTPSTHPCRDYHIET